MDRAWRCPACQTIAAYEDWDAANGGKVFPCRKCALSLIIDRKADQPIAAKKPPTKPDPTTPDR